MKNILLGLIFLASIPSLAQTDSIFFDACFCEYQGVAGGDIEVRMYGLLVVDGSDVKIKNLGNSYSDGSNLEAANNLCIRQFKPLIKNNICPSLD